jgi:hypothetical protein
MKYDTVKKNAPQLLSLTGFCVEDFEYLLPIFKFEWAEHNSRFTLDGKPRQRIYYNRKSTHLPMIGDKLLFILSYLKNNPLQEYHGATFGLTQPQCNVWIHLLTMILEKTLGNLQQLPDVNGQRMYQKLRDIQDVFLDGTERPVQRPQAEDVQKSRYSGKKNAYRKE